MKLAQGQVWKLSDQEFIWIVTWARLEIEFKRLDSQNSHAGAVEKVTKKEFCRIVKHGELVETRNGKS
ncbi:MAG: hypothetical protein ACKVJU_08680 [Verrucomicrobiales bacterium]